VKGLVIVAWLTFVVNQEISRRRAMTNVVVEGRASMLAHAVPIAFGASVLIRRELTSGVETGSRAHLFGSLPVRTTSDVRRCGGRGRWNRIRCRECCGFSRRSDRLPRARHQGANREKLAGADQGSRRDRPVLSVSNMLGTSGIL